MHTLVSCIHNIFDFGCLITFKFEQGNTNFMSIPLFI